MHLPAYRVKPGYTVGAGDAFNAGFIKAQMEGRDLRESMCFANATAAEKISHGGIPTMKHIEERLKTMSSSLLGCGHD